MMAYKICPRCFKTRRYDEGCTTSECVELQKSPTYLRDELEGTLFIARERLKAGNTEADWAAVVRELEIELMMLDGQRGAAAFKQ
jgi:hypothetical protein